MRLLLVFALTVCAASADICVLPAGAILRVALGPKSPRSIKAGSPLEGVIEQPVYHATCRLLPGGVPVRAVGAAQAMDVKLSPPGLTPIAMKAAAVRMKKEKPATAAGKPGKTVRTLLLRVTEAVAIAGAAEAASTGQGAIAAGVRVRVALESAVGSKAGRRGEPVQARLLEPVLADGKVLVPEGALVQGTLSEARGARRLYRSGSLRLSFQSLHVGPDLAVNTPLTVAAGQLSGGSRIDGEGTITGSALTKKRALINLGISYATGKILDDVIEEGAKTVYGIAAAGSAELAARYVGLGVGVAGFLLHRGREVKLEPYTELVLTFSRPVEIAK